jgi:8-oxo-dGTP pyrophosphatase MutT (NUDIX family)
MNPRGRSPRDPSDGSLGAARASGGEWAEWPDGVVSARAAFERRLPGWPLPGEEPPGPTLPVPPGRGGAQKIPRPFNARPGGPASWADLPADRRRPAVDDVRAALAALGPVHPSPRELGDSRARPSAVLAPLYDDAGEAVVVLTRRTWGLRTHQGEVSFPGGRVDAGEAPVDGALREAEEEIGLDSSTVEIIGELDHLATVSSWSYIVPYVGVLPGLPETRPNPAEVEAVLHVPLRELLDPEIYREELWTFPGDSVRPIYFFELAGDTVWGATAALLRQLLGVVTGTLGRGDLGHD